MDVPHVVLATGSALAARRFWPAQPPADPGGARHRVYSPDDVMAGVPIAGSMLVFDDDDYYMGGVLAETLRRRGHPVTLVTPSPLVSAWTVNTLEQEKIQRQILEAGIEVVANANLPAVRPGEVDLACMFTDRVHTCAADAIVLVTARLPETGFHEALKPAIGSGALRSLTRIGDCNAPGTIAAAVFSGRRVAEDLDEPVSDLLPFRTEPVATERPLTMQRMRLRAAE